MKFRLLALLAMIVLMVPVLTNSPQQVIRVETANGDLLACTRVDAGDVAQLQFTHSMFGGYVREQWEITPDGQLNRLRFVTENAAAAEYYATDGASYQADDGFVVPGDPLQQPELIVRVNNRGNHVLTVAGNEWHLAEMVDESTQVRIFIDTGSCGEIEESMSGKDD